MKRSQTAQVITALSIQGGWIKLLQARSTGEARPALLGMKAREIRGRNEEEVAATLQQMVRTLPVAPDAVLGLLSTGEVLTRYLSLPSDNPAELKSMALYQMEGVLPYPIQECITSVKVLGTVGEATRVLVAAAHRPNVEHLIRICRKAGLKLTGIAASSETIGYWHRVCWPGAPAYPDVWLVAEVTRDGLDMGVLLKGSLVYMRQVPYPFGDIEELVSQLQDTIAAYAREQVGPPVKQITISGSLEGFGPGALEQIEASLELPVQRVDPLEVSPFRESLSVTAQELSPEVSFSELLGAACAPRLLGLDLLPVEIQIQQARQKLFRELRRTVVLCSAVLALVLGWVGTKIMGTGWQLRQVQSEIRQCEPPMSRVRAMAATVRSVGAARRDYAFQIDCLAAAAQRLSPGMTLQFVGLDELRTLSVRGMAPDFNQVTRYSAELRQQPLWREVALRSAKHRILNGVSGVEFELVLQLRRLGKRGSP